MAPGAVCPLSHCIIGAGPVCVMICWQESKYLPSKKLKPVSGSCPATAILGTIVVEGKSQGVEFSSLSGSVPLQKARAFPRRVHIFENPK